MKVKYVPFQPHCFAFGGFDLQMLNTLEAVKKSGIAGEKLNPWSRDNDFQVMHCWGLGFAHYENIRWAKHSGKKVVMTALFSYYESKYERLRHYLSTYIKKAQYYIQIANMVDAMVVLNELQAEACHKYFKVPQIKIHIIPNVIHPTFFKLDDGSIKNDLYLRDYVLIVGSVCRRKNQLNLIKACIKGNHKLVIVGKILDGEDDYGNEIESLIPNHENIKWIKGLPEHSDALYNYYNNCALVALPSFIEQQPISLLEGVAMKKPLLIADRAYAKQKFYKNALQINPDSIDEIEKGIAEILKSPANYTPPIASILDCSEESVGNSYRSLYEGLLV